MCSQQSSERLDLEGELAGAECERAVEDVNSAVSRSRSVKEVASPVYWRRRSCVNVPGWLAAITAVVEPAAAHLGPSP